MRKKMLACLGRCKRQSLPGLGLPGLGLPPHAVMAGRMDYPVVPCFFSTFPLRLRRRVVSTLGF